MQYLHIFLDLNMQKCYSVSEIRQDIGRCGFMTELKRQRLLRKLTQKEAAERIGVSLRTYVTYENNEQKEKTAKYRFFLAEILEASRVDEDHGVLTVEEIRNACGQVFEKYPVDFAVLFGSYAKGNATESSDVDIVVATELSGLRFFELAEVLRTTLHKRVDLLDYKQLIGNEQLLYEVLLSGVRIYGKQEG